MGKASKRAARGGRAPATKKVAPAVTSTMSKRSGKKNERRKVASKDRNAALCLRLHATREADAAAAAQADRFQADGLLGALDVIARESPAAAAASKNATNGRTNRGKRLLAEQEARQLGAVLAHPAFAANPVDAIFEHLANTLPPPPAAAAPTRGKKKRQQR